MAHDRNSAPYGTCPACGWSGHDWAFTHQQRCGNCYREGREGRAAERRERNVEKRLMQTAQAEVPQSLRHRLGRWIPALGVALLVGGSIAFFALDLDAYVGGRYLLLVLAVCLLAVLVLANRMAAGELAKRLVLVRGRLTGLIGERSRRVQESEAFYASPEWKDLRDAVIEEQGLVCRGCGAALGSGGEATVGHVRSRGDRPDLALSEDNLQVLCRTCNPTKRNREPE
jgi:hypothetical protein